MWIELHSGRPLILIGIYLYVVFKHHFECDLSICNQFLLCGHWEDSVPHTSIMWSTSWGSRVFFFLKLVGSPWSDGLWNMTSWWLPHQDVSFWWQMVVAYVLWRQKDQGGSFLEDKEKREKAWSSCCHVAIDSGLMKASALEWKLANTRLTCLFNFQAWIMCLMCFQFLGINLQNKLTYQILCDMAMCSQAIQI